MKTLTFIVAFSIAIAGCAASPAPSPASEVKSASTTTAAPASSTTAAKPETAKATDHLKNHVKYPATRAQLLAACADTPEFTAQEKKWFADNVPEGTYKS